METLYNGHFGEYKTVVIQRFPLYSEVVMYSNPSVPTKKSVIERFLLLGESGSVIRIFTVYGCISFMIATGIVVCM